MQKLKLNQLNKQKVADREMNAIKGGTTTGPNDDSIGDAEFAGICWNGGPWGGGRAWNEWNDVCCCLLGDVLPKYGMVVI